MQGRFATSTRLIAGAAVVVALSGLPSGASATELDGATTLTCPQGTYSAPGLRELGDFAPFRATDGSVFAPKAYGEVTVVLRTEGEPTEVGTLAPSSLGSADRGSQSSVVCGFSWSRAYVLDGRRHLDSYFGTVTVVASGRAG